MTYKINGGIFEIKAAILAIIDYFLHHWHELRVYHLPHGEKLMM